MEEGGKVNGDGEDEELGEVDIEEERIVVGKDKNSD